jgi:hypothetical protein
MLLALWRATEVHNYRWIQQTHPSGESYVKGRHLCERSSCILYVLVRCRSILRPVKSASGRCGTGTGVYQVLEAVLSVDSADEGMGQRHTVTRRVSCQDARV